MKPIDSLTIVEIDQRVIHLVEPHIADPRLEVVCCDIHDYKPERKFDSIWFDIWANICTDNLAEIATLHQRGKYWKKSRESLMTSWHVETLRYLRRQDRWR